LICITGDALHNIKHKHPNFVKKIALSPDFLIVLISDFGKTKRRKKGEQPVFTDTLRRIEPLRFEEGVRGGGLKVISNCAYRQGEERAFFLHKIKRIEDHDWTDTWKESGQSTLWAFFF
jgi:hypothetical protein